MQETKRKVTQAVNKIERAQGNLNDVSLPLATFGHCYMSPESSDGPSRRPGTSVRMGAFKEPPSYVEPSNFSTTVPLVHELDEWSE